MTQSRHIMTRLGMSAVAIVMFATLTPITHAFYDPDAPVDIQEQARAQEQRIANQCHRLGAAAPCVKGPCPTGSGITCIAVTCNDPSSAIDCKLVDFKPEGGSIEPEFVFKPVNAVLQIPIPNLQFSNILNNVRSVDGTTDVVSVPWIGEYIAALYRWSIPIGAMLAVIAIMIGGVIWLTSAGAERLSAAKTWITNAVIGLLILICSYVILNIINPDLVNFTQLSIRITKPEKLIFTDEPDVVEGTMPSSIVSLTENSTNNIVGSIQIDQPLVEKVLKAAEELKTLHVQLYLTSGFRSYEKQVQLIKENCQNPPGSATCNKKPGRPATCILKNGLTSCPHTTGNAIDAWGAVNKTQCIDQAKCLKDLNACRENVCQKEVIKAMRANEFCNWTPEPWHFEKGTGMSKPCN